MDQPASIASNTAHIRRSVGEISRRRRSPGLRSGSSGSRRNSSPLDPISSERIPLRNASLNVRPIAIASPTDFICVVRVGSAFGNFSNVQRGTLTTT